MSGVYDLSSQEAQMPVNGDGAPVDYGLPGYTSGLPDNAYDLLARTPMDYALAGSDMSMSGTPLAESSFETKEAGPVTIPMNIMVQSLSTKAAVGMVAEESDDHPSGIYVFSSGQKYRLVLDMDVADLPGSSKKFQGELSLQLEFTHTARKRPADSDGNWECFLSRVETLIEQDSKDPEYPDLKTYLHVNEFENVPVTLQEGKLRIVTRIWPCLFSGTKRRTKQEDHENILFSVTFAANSPSQGYHIISSGQVQVCVVPKSSYYKRKSKKPKGRAAASAGHSSSNGSSKKPGKLAGPEVGQKRTRADRDGDHPLIHFNSSHARKKGRKGDDDDEDMSEASDDEPEPEPAPAPRPSRAAAKKKAEQEVKHTPKVKIEHTPAPKKHAGSSKSAKPKQSDAGAAVPQPSQPSSSSSSSSSSMPQHMLAAMHQRMQMGHQVKLEGPGSSMTDAQLMQLQASLAQQGIPGMSIPQGISALQQQSMYQASLLAATGRSPMGMPPGVPSPSPARSPMTMVDSFLSPASPSPYNRLAPPSPGLMTRAASPGLMPSPSVQLPLSPFRPGPTTPASPMSGPHTPGPQTPNPGEDILSMLNGPAPSDDGDVSMTPAGAVASYGSSASGSSSGVFGAQPGSSSSAAEASFAAPPPRPTATKRRRVS